MIMFIRYKGIVLANILCVSCIFHRDFQGYADKEATKKKVMKDVWRKGDLCFRYCPAEHNSIYHQETSTYHNDIISMHQDMLQVR